MVDFLIMCNTGSVICKDIFPLIKDRTVRLGVTLFVGTMPIFTHKDGKSQALMVTWLTTLDNHKDKKFIKLKKYDPETYKKYDNLMNGINVDRTVDIPDYDGVIGVPISFLDKWNPEQFDIVCLLTGCSTSVNGRNKFVRILIRRRK